MRSPRIVFFGSGPVAAASLKGLADDFEIEAVITKTSTETEMSSVAGNTQIFTANNRSELDKLIASNSFQSGLGVLVDFGVIVSKEAIGSFPLGIINSHFSLLPEWRGADPITFSILSGQKTTGVSLMLLVEAMDEGPLLAQMPYEIPPNTTTPELTNELIDISNKSLREIIPLFCAGSIVAAPQEEVTMAESKTPTYSRKLTKQDGLIDWSKPAEQIEREIRAFQGWPKSRTTLAGRDVIITKAYPVPTAPSGSKPGDIETVRQAGTIMVCTGKGSLCITQLKPAGKKEMSAAAFLAGYKI